MVVVGAVDIGRHAIDGHDREFGLETAHLNLAGIGKIAAHQAQSPVVHVGLIILDHRPEAGDIERRPPIQEL